MTNPLLWTLVGSLAAVLTTLGFVPQVVRMWRTRSVGDVSPLTFFQFTTGSSLWLAYGFYRQDPVILAANVGGLGILGVAILLWFHLRPKHPR